MFSPWSRKRGPTPPQDVVARRTLLPLSSATFPVSPIHSPRQGWRPQLSRHDTCSGIPWACCCLPGLVSRADGHVKIVGSPGGATAPAVPLSGSQMREWTGMSPVRRGWGPAAAGLGTMGQQRLSPRQGQGKGLIRQRTLGDPSVPCRAPSLEVRTDRRLSCALRSWPRRMLQVS